MNNIGMKRFFAYAIDIFIVTTLFSFISYFIPDTYIAKILDQDLSNLMEKYMRAQIEFKEFFEKSISLIQNLDIERVRFNIVNFIFIIAYFGVYPVYNKGKTIGMTLLGLKIKKDGKGPLRIKQLILKSILINGLIYSLVSFMLMAFLDPKPYFIILTIVGLMQVLLVIINAFMIIYNKEKRGIIDVWTKTNIVLLKKGD